MRFDGERRGDVATWAGLIISAFHSWHSLARRRECEHADRLDELRELRAVRPPRRRVGGRHVNYLAHFLAHFLAPFLAHLLGPWALRRRPAPADAPSMEPRARSAQCLQATCVADLMLPV